MESHWVENIVLWIKWRMGSHALCMNLKRVLPCYAEEVKHVS